MSLLADPEASKSVTGSVDRSSESEAGTDPLDSDSETEVPDTVEHLPPEHYARTAMSREELALALRPMIGDGKGQTFVARDPAYDIADAVLAMSPDDEFWVDGQSFETPGKGVQNLFGADDRTIAPNSNPYRWMVHFSNNCSGVFIGWHTIITAGHCVYNPATNTFKTPLTLTVFKQGANSTGLGQIYVPNEFVGGGISFPSAFDDNTPQGSATWDFAVIDLTGYASSPTGWNGYWVNYGGSSMKMYGYPRAGSGGILCPGKTEAGWLCGMTGVGEIHDHMLESWTIDSSAGQSGGPWLASTNHTVAVHCGFHRYHDFARCGFDQCRRTWGRRLDSVFWNFIVAESADW